MTQNKNQPNNPNFHALDTHMQENVALEELGNKMSDAKIDCPTEIDNNKQNQNASTNKVTGKNQNIQQPKNNSSLPIINANINANIIQQNSPIHDEDKMEIEEDDKNISKKEETSKFDSNSEKESTKKDEDNEDDDEKVSLNCPIPRSNHERKNKKK